MSVLEMRVQQRISQRAWTETLCSFNQPNWKGPLHVFWAVSSISCLYPILYPMFPPGARPAMRPMGFGGPEFGNGDKRFLLTNATKLFGTNSKTDSAPDVKSHTLLFPRRWGSRVCVSFETPAAL